MSVVFCSSTGKMTHRNNLLVLVVTIGWLEGIAGAAFSNVIVSRDEVIPVEYFSYDPSLFINSQAAKLSMLPLGAVAQVPSVSTNVSPCLAPCIIPDTDTQGPTSISSSNAEIITYKTATPNVPVVITNKETARGYQYAYAVYDDITGDKKSQSEQSDGSAVRGQYSFIQPDGYRREVVYTADDLKGFNSVVRNISPESEQPIENKVKVVKVQPAPCPETHNTELTQLHQQSEERTIPENEHLEGPRIVQNGDKISVENPKQKAEKEKSHEEEPCQTVEDTSHPILGNTISYNDIIKCLQAKLRSTNSAVSPLTYILIPSLKGPC